MSEQVATSAPAEMAAFDMKAGQFTLPALVLRSGDIAGLDDFLARQVAKLPAFFDQAPVVVDVSQLDDGQALDALPMLVGMLRGHGMIPVGLRGGSDEQRNQARALELAIMPAGRKVAPPPAASPAPAGEIVDRPVRSGQRIVAEHGDLILLDGVSSGAEVMAAGNIHCYGALRGRAMAGFAGDTSARIFCRALGADLVSIAGRYRVNENLESRYLGRAVQIALDGDALRFTLM